MKIKDIWKTLGPGLITGASDDDPSGIATYSQAGAAFGLSTLWTAWLTFPLMACVQEMCARIGVVTTHGLAGTLRLHYPRRLLLLMILFSFPAIILNIGADIAGMGAVTHLLIPAVPTFYFSVGYALLLLVVLIKVPYEKLSKVLKYLCAVLLVYLILPFMAKHGDGLEILRAAFIPALKFDKEYIGILVAILGTTISPYLFFWQASMEAEDMKKDGRRIVVNRKIIHDMKVDVNFGMFFSNLIMFFIILTAGTVLFKGGIHEIVTIEQAAKALEPLAGKAAYYLFAAGILGTGFLAIPVLSGSLSYILSETFGWNAGLNKNWRDAKLFYGVIAVSLILGLSINYLGISPIQALLYSAMLYGVTAPVLIAIVLHIANNRKVMGKYTNGKLSNALGVTTLLLMTAAAAALIYYKIKG